MEMQIEDKEKSLLLRQPVIKQSKKSDIKQKIKLPEDDGLTDVVRIFTSMKEAGIIDKETPTTNIARLFCDTEDEVREFAGKYYSTEKNTADFKRNSNSKKLFEFICHLIEKAYNKKPDKIDELTEFLEQLRKDSYKSY